MTFSEKADCWPSTIDVDNGERLIERVVAELISWDLSQTREGSLALMEDVVGEPSLSTAALFEEYLEDQARELTAVF